MRARLLELKEVMRQEVHLLALGQVQELTPLLARKLDLLQQLSMEVRSRPVAEDRAELQRLWRQNRHLLQVLKPYVPDAVPSASDRRREGWRG